MLNVCYNRNTDENIPPLLLWRNPQVQVMAKKTERIVMFRVTTPAGVFCNRRIESVPSGPTGKIHPFFGKQDEGKVDRNNSSGGTGCT
jgi:hypothetical protein